MAIGADDLAERGGEDGRMGIGPLGPLDHALEAFDLGRQALAARLRAFDAQAELEVLLVAHQDVGHAGDLAEHLAQLFLAVLPERGAMIQVEGDPRAVFLGGPGQLQAERARLGRERRDQARQVDDLHALPAEDPLQIEILDVERPADFAGAVVVHSRPARAAAAVGDVELVAIAPRPALLDLRALVLACAGWPGCP